MARILPRKDVVIMGLGWTGSILAHELTEAGLDVLAIERGPWPTHVVGIGFCLERWA